MSRRKSLLILMLLVSYPKGAEFESSSSETCDKEETKTFEISLGNTASMAEAEKFLREQLKKYAGKVKITTSINGRYVSSLNMNQEITVPTPTAVSSACTDTISPPSSVTSPSKDDNHIVTSTNTEAGDSVAHKCYRNKFYFPKENGGYLIYEPFPNYPSISFCAWLTPEGKGTVLSHYSLGNLLLVEVDPPERIDIRTPDGKDYRWQGLGVTSRTHFCIRKEQQSVHLFINGSRAGEPVPGNGSSIPQVLGSMSDLLIIGGLWYLPGVIKGSPSRTSTGDEVMIGSRKGYSGYMEDVFIWRRVLNDDEITNVKNGSCSCLYNDTVPLTQRNLHARGGAQMKYWKNCE